MTDPGAAGGGESGPSEEKKTEPSEESKSGASEESKSGAAGGGESGPSEESKSGASEEKRGPSPELVKGLMSASKKLDDWKDKLTEIHDALDRLEATVNEQVPVETLHQMSLYEDRVGKLEKLVGELERETGGTEDPVRVKDFRRDMVMAVNQMTQWMEPEIDAVRQGKDWTLGNILNVLAHLEGCVEAYKRGT